MQAVIADDALACSLVCVVASAAVAMQKELLTESLCSCKLKSRLFLTTGHKQRLRRREQ